MQPSEFSPWYYFIKVVTIKLDIADPLTSVGAADYFPNAAGLKFGPT